MAMSRTKPNVLFLPVDDLRPQLGCYGHRQMISPHIDRLASEGVLFRRAYCQVPVCGASRASLLTGVRPTTTRFIDFNVRTDDDLPGALVLPEHFRKHGYATVSRGKVFHHNDDCAARSWSEAPTRPTGAWGGRGYLVPENRALAESNVNRTGCGPAYEAGDVPDNAYADGKLADQAIADLGRLKDAGRPFFLAVGFFKPHLPFNAPKKYWDLYKHDDIDLADNPLRPRGAPDCAMHNWGELRAYTGIPDRGPLPDETARTLIHGYYACVSYLDAQLGRVLAELQRLGLRQSTLVVLWGDHGWQLGEHGLWCKHANFDTSLHAPLLVSGPGIAGGKATSGLVEFVDIYPALCDLAGQPVPEHLEGTSFAPLVEQPDRPWKPVAFSRYFDGDSVKTDRYLYTEWRKGGKGKPYGRMLYDHQADPAENANIAEEPGSAELVARLSKMLRDGPAAARPPALP